MKRSIFTLLLMAFPLFLRAQAPEIQWQKSFGSDGEDVLHIVKPTLDGGYILGGFSEHGSSGDRTDTSRGFYDIWILKLDRDRNIEWQRALGGTGDEGVYEIIQTTDSGYVLFSVTGSGISGDKTDTARDLWPIDMWLVKLDKSGSVQWQKTIGGNGIDGASFGVSMGDEIGDWSVPGTIDVVPVDDGFIISLPSGSDISGEKTDTSRTWDGGFFSALITDIWIVKINNSGVIQWQKTIGAELSEAPVSLMADPSGGYILGAVSCSGISGEKTDTCRAGFPVTLMDVLDGKPVYDYWILKLDNAGNIEWQKTIGGDSTDLLVGVLPLPQGGYIAGGNSNSSVSGERTIPSRGKSDFWIVKLDNTGNIEWQKAIGGNGDDYLISMQVTADSGFILAGGSLSDSTGEKNTPVRGFSDYWLVKLDMQGNIEWQKTLGGTNDGTVEMATRIYQTPDGDYVVGGSSPAANSGDKTSPGQGDADYWIIGLACKVDSTVTVSDGTITASQHGAHYQWLDCNTGAPVSGAAAQSFSPSATGDYRAVVTLKGCRDTSACHHIEVVGINDPEHHTDGLSVYPNPAGDQVVVMTSSGIRNVRIMNTLGAIVRDATANGANRHAMDLTGLLPGIYTIQVFTSKEMISRKLEIIK